MALTTPSISKTHKPTPSKRTSIDRNELIPVIANAFTHKGYEGTTITQLSTATGLRKASLYHHFPGGKQEMAAIVLRRAVSDLQRLAFQPLHNKGTPLERLLAFIDGFAEYCNVGRDPCLIATLMQGSAHVTHGPAVAQQFDTWHTALANVYVEAGEKPKRGLRAAKALIAMLYGSLLTAHMQNDPQGFRQNVKRLRKDLEQTYG